jgi:hypothetical protein
MKVNGETTLGDLFAFLASHELRIEAHAKDGDWFVYLTNGKGVVRYAASGSSWIEAVSRAVEHVGKDRPRPKVDRLIQCKGCKQIAPTYGAIMHRSGCNDPFRGSA